MTTENQTQTKRKLSEQWADLSKKANEVGNLRAKEALTVTADLLKSLSKELNQLGEKVAGWAADAEKRAGATGAAAKTNGATATPPPDTKKVPEPAKA